MLFNGRNDTINFIAGYGSMILEAKRKATEELKEQEGTRLKILTPKQMLQRLPIALAQVKAGNNSENLLNGIRQIVYSFYQSKEITKKVYNNTVTSIIKMDTIFMNSENRKSSEPYILILNSLIN